MAKQRMQLMKGKGLGGSSLVNYLLYTRGHREDFDSWAAQGNPGWSFKDVVPHFKAIENAQIPFFNAETRGAHGEVNVVEVPEKSLAVKKFIEGCQQVGIKINRDYNSGQSMGVGYLQTNSKRGKRQHTEKVFLRPAYKRKNLVVKKMAKVTKLLIIGDKGTKRVDSVEYYKSLKTHKVKARREVILCAGWSGSPHILMLSGIGPKKHLEELGIKVVQDLPVGQIVRDHVTYSSLVFRVKGKAAPSLLEIASPVEIGKYIFKGTGRLADPVGIAEAMAYAKLPGPLGTNDTRPNVEFMFGCAGLQIDFGLIVRKEMGLSKSSYKRIFGPLTFKRAWTVLPMILQPKSKGYMRLRSKNPHDPPKFYDIYFSDPEGKDMKAMIASIRILMEIARTQPMLEIGTRPGYTALPACKKFDPNLDFDKYWECQLRQIAFAAWHFVSTCKMGPKNDTEAVVDNKLKVYGLENLRVADASIMPDIPGAHTNAASMMIGDKAAAMILAA